jgi:hypothetical protein
MNIHKLTIGGHRIMRKKYLTGALIAVLAFFVQLPAFTQTREDLQDMYVNHLKAEGYLPEIDSDGDIKFKVSGDVYYIIVNDDDLRFFQMYELISISNEEHRRKALPAAQYATRRTKGVKVYISENGNTATIAIEIFVPKPEDYKGVFRRLLSVIEKADRDFISQF